MLLTNEQTDNAISRVAFATENIICTRGGKWVSVNIHLDMNVDSVLFMIQNSAILFEYKTKY